MNLKLLLLSASLLTLSTMQLAAQTTTPSERHSIAARSTNQQARINKGVADGQITPRGAAHADANQARINSQDARMRSRDSGHLTAANRHKLASEQNRTSQGVYNRNHNAATDPGVAPK
jgi:hypothetical protein